MTLDLSGEDSYKDAWYVEAYGPTGSENGVVYLDLFQSSGTDTEHAMHAYSPKKARKLATALLDAADFAEAIAL